MRTRRCWRWMIGVGLALPLLANADFCAERAEAALAELTAVYGPGGGAQVGAAREVLVRLCQDARDGAGSAVADAGIRAAPAPAAAVDDEAETSRLLGVEFRKAAPDSAGNQRLRRRP